ncbi:5-methylcytosine restriction system specificity protein McrC [Nocardia niigatensis]
MTNLKVSDRDISPYQVIQCREQEEISVPIASLFDDAGKLDLHLEVVGKDYFSVSMRKTSVRLLARGFVGFIPLNDRIVVRIRPRVDIGNLERIVEIAGVETPALLFERQYLTSHRWNPSFVDLYAQSLTSRVQAILDEGLFREYERREGISSFPRGRLLIHQTLQKFETRGIHHLAQNAWFERTVDNSANRCIKYALWLLSQYYVNNPPQTKEGRRLRNRVVGLLNAFRDVTLDHTHEFTRNAIVAGRVPPPATRAHYREALEIANAVVMRRGIEMDGDAGDLILPSVVLDLSEAFERYLRNVLVSYVEVNGAPVTVQDGNLDGKVQLFSPALDSAGNPKVKSPSATPDIIVRSNEATSPLVADVKYIPLSGSGLSPRSAFDQVITYATVYGSSRAVLMHPLVTGQRSGLRHLGTAGQVELYQYLYDLAADLPEEEEKFGIAITELAGTD